MQSVLRKEESPAGNPERFKAETPASRKCTSDAKKVALFCNNCREARTQNPAVIPANTFIDCNGFLWHCQRPECEHALWNLDRQFILGCRVLEDRYRSNPGIRRDLDRLARVEFAAKV